MAACGSLQPHLPENHPTLVQSLSTSWTQINRSLKNPIMDRHHHHHSSFPDIFGELHFKDSHPPPETPSSLQPTSPPSSIIDLISKPTKIENLRITTTTTNGGGGDDEGRASSASTDSFASFRGLSPMMNHESLQLCTEGLGFESSDDMEDLISSDTETPSSTNNEEDEKEELNLMKKHSLDLDVDLGWDEDQKPQFRRSKSCGGAFPPPISSIGKTGKPWVSFKSFRKDGRFVLKEIRVPMREFLHAYRENGRLKLQLVQPEEDIAEEEGEEDDNDDDDGSAGENGGEICNDEDGVEKNVRTGSKIGDHSNAGVD